MSPGVSNAYAMATDAGRVIVNTGLAFEGPLHRRAFDAVLPAVHPDDHRAHRDIPTTGAASDSSANPTPRSSCTPNYRYWRDDMARLSTFRAGHTGFAFGKFGQALMEHLKSVDLSSVDMSFTEPTGTFDKDLGS